MASFCSGCGFPQGPNVTFCPNCGARQQGAPNPAPAATPAAPAVAASSAGMSTGVKIVIGLLVFMMVSGIAAIGGMWYLAHRVKQAVTESAKAAGVELPGPTVTHSSATPRHIPKPCEVLSNSEVSTLIGEPIERSLVDNQGCNYFGPQGLAAQRAQEHAGTTFNKMKSTGAQPGIAEVMGAVSQLSTTVAASQDTTNASREAPFLMLILDPDGKSQMTALNISKSLFSGIMNAAGDSGKALTSEVPGLGDRAIRMQPLGLNVLKGDLLIRIIPGPVVDPDEKSIEIARAVLKKLD